MLNSPYHQWWRCIFFFNDTATTEIYTLSLHDALPILTDVIERGHIETATLSRQRQQSYFLGFVLDRKSTRLNSSHSQISYAVFCLKKTTLIPLVSKRPCSGSRYGKCDGIFRRILADRL